MAPAQVESLRPLLPVGTESAAQAYREAAQGLDARALTHHYTEGLGFFHDHFVPQLKERLSQLTGGAWQLDDFEAYAAGSDVDLMSHLVEAVAARQEVALYPGDWYGFLVGSTHHERFVWTRESQDRLACLCLPSVRNGQLTLAMERFLQDASACLLNINLFPTLHPEERRGVAQVLQPMLDKSILSVSFSRGFGLTASQLGVFLVHKSHPYRQRFEQQWRWFTYFYNRIAAEAFLKIDLEALSREDDKRRQWAIGWLEERGLPVVSSGSYYVKSFRVEGEVPEAYRPLLRGELLRLCLKPEHP